MARTVTRAGRKGVCPHCGSDRLRIIWIDNQDKVDCQDCKRVFRPCKARFPVTRTGSERVFAAVAFLTSAEDCPVSRLAVARHLGVAKNNYLIRSLRFLVNTGAIVEYDGVSPYNGRLQKVYLPWTAHRKRQEAPGDPQKAIQGITAPKPPWKRENASQRVFSE
jgi:hypothetical protein